MQAPMDVSAWRRPSYWTSLKIEVRNFFKETSAKVLLRGVRLRRPGLGIVKGSSETQVVRPCFSLVQETGCDTPDSSRGINRLGRYTVAVRVAEH